MKSKWTTIIQNHIQNHEPEIQTKVWHFKSVQVQMWVQLFSSMKRFSPIQSKNNNSISSPFSSNQILTLLPLRQRVTMRRWFPHWCDGEDEMKVWDWLAILNPVCECARPHTADQSPLRPSFQPSKKTWPKPVLLNFHITPVSSRPGTLLFSNCKINFSLSFLLINHRSLSPISSLLSLPQVSAAASLRCCV